jgi:hypothetical protein
MGRYGIDFYGTGVRYGNAALVQFSAAPFYSVSETYGSVNLFWNRPTGTWTKFRLVRNKYGFPLDTDYGVVLLEKINESFKTEFTDSNLEQGRTYYYSIFVLPSSSSNFDWVRAGNSYGVSVKDFNTFNTMWSYLPIVYRSTALVTSTPDSGKTIYDYTNSRENEDLKSLLRIFAFEYDLQKTLATNLMYSSDTTYVDGHYIAPMMQQFGLKFEPEIGLQQSRVLLRNALKIYKTKGSYAGLITYLKSYTGWDLSTVLGKNLMLDVNDSSFDQSIGAWVSSTATLEQQKSGVITAPGGGSFLLAYKGDVDLPASFPNLQNYLLKVTTTSAGTVTFDCGYYPSPLSGKTNGIPVKSANITGVSADGTYITYYTTGNNFVNGDKVTITGLSTSGFNLSNATVYSSTGYEFKIASAVTGTSQGITDTPPTSGILTSIGVAGGNYTFSIYGVSAATARTATLTIKWHDLGGNYLSTSSPGTGVSLPVAAMAKDTSGRPTVSAVAPVNAAFATPCISLAATTLGQIFYLDAAMFENSSAATTFEDSRLIKITFKASRINELKNPNFETNTQWTSSTSTLALTPISGVVPLSNKALVTQPSATGEIAVASENITTIRPNTTYTFSVYAKYFGSTPSASNALTASIGWYTSGGTLIGGAEQFGTPVTTGNLTDFVRPNVTSTSPSNAAYAIAKIKYPTTTTALRLILDEALFESSAYVNSYFDGATGVTSLTNLIWEGAIDASRSHYYKNRGTIQGRLITDLPNYLTLGSQFQLLFAKP